MESTQSAFLSLGGWTAISEIFRNFAIGLGALGGGLFVGLKFVVEFILSIKKISYKAKFHKLYPREKLNDVFKIVDTERGLGKLYLVDLKKKEKYWIQSATTLLDLNFFWDDAKRISQEEFDSYREGPAILTSGEPGT